MIDTTDPVVSTETRIMFIRSKVVRDGTYWQVVEGYRDAGGAVKHRNVVSLGRHPTIAEALAAEKRHLTRLKRHLTRLKRGHGISITNPSLAQAHKYVAMDRQIAASAAKVETLTRLASVPTPKRRTASVDTTRDVVSPDRAVEVLNWKYGQPFDRAEWFMRAELKAMPKRDHAAYLAELRLLVDDLSEDQG
jgi:hypothetical protein